MAASSSYRVDRSFSGVIDVDGWYAGLGELVQNLPVALFIYSLPPQCPPRMGTITYQTGTWYRCAPFLDSDGMNR